MGGIAVIAVPSFLAGRRYGWNHPLPIEPRIDTCWVYDTTIVYQPKYIYRRVVDSIAIPVKDTTIIHDTAYIFVPKESIEWTDSLCTIYASGYKPSIDSVKHYTQTAYITKEIPVVKVKKTRWGIGVQVGYGVGYCDKRVIGTPYVGVGVSYNLISW